MPSPQNYFCLESVNDVVSFDSMPVAERRELLECFLAEITERVERIRGKSRVSPEFLEELHALKGTAKTFGAFPFGQVSEDWEFSLMNGNPGRELEATFFECFARTAAAIKGCIRDLE